jgi:hypothetical protein
MNKTQHSLKILAKVIISKLENKKLILFNPLNRNQLVENYYNFLKNNILTDQDLSEMARLDVSKNLESLEDANFSESEAYRSQKKALIKKYEENSIQGFFLKKTLKQIIEESIQFLFDNELIEDVFASDEELYHIINDTIRTFDDSKVA